MNGYNDMELKDIKKFKDKHCTRFILAQIDCLKTICKLNKNARVYYLDTWQLKSYFLCGNKIYVATFKYEDENYLNPSIELLYSIKLDKDFELTEIITDTNTQYTIKDFNLWYESPTQVNELVNVSNKKAIEFLQKYNKNTFKTERYLFYVKRDKDTTWSFYIYVKDLKTNIEAKIYLDNWEDINNNPRKIYVDTFSNNLSKQQQLNIKKAFLTYCNDICEQLNAPNYYAMEFVKQCIQPIEFHKGWFVRPAFIGNFEFQNIFIDDVLSYDKKPYFFIANGTKINAEITKVAVLDFFTPSYKSTNIYVSGTYKRLHWDLDKETITNLIKFLKQPFDFTKTSMYQKHNYKFENSEIKTNWQWLISEFNENCGIDTGVLPLDLPMPDYTILVNNKRKKDKP